jgi:hypothetical protein
MQREQKITLGEMRQSGGPTRLLASVAKTTAKLGRPINQRSPPG